MKFKNIINSFQKINKSIYSLSFPYYYGFVQGHNYLGEDQIKEIAEVLNSKDAESNHEIVKEFEDRFSKIIGDGFGVSFAAGRMAFFALMKILGIGHGDEVILLGFSCSVMPNAVLKMGATPIYSDIDIETFGSDPIFIEKKISSRTKLIVAQHSFGIPCKIQEIVEIAHRNNIFVLEDCAMTLDSSFNGKKVGNFGDAAIFSTDHSKPINTIIGGFFYTKTFELYEKVKSIQNNIPDLNDDHQIRLFKQFLLERKYCNPGNYPKFDFINYRNFIFNKLKFFKDTFVFLEDDFFVPIESKKRYPYPAKYPAFLAKMGLYEIENWAAEKKRRKKNLQMYLDVVNDLNLERYISPSYFNKSMEIIPLRFVFTYPYSMKIKEEIKNYVDIKSTWFVLPVNYSLGNEYKEHCKNCIFINTVCNTILNWPINYPDGWESKIMEIFKNAFH